MGELRFFQLPLEAYIVNPPGAKATTLEESDA